MHRMLNALCVQPPRAYLQRDHEVAGGFQAVNCGPLFSPGPRQGAGAKGSSSRGGRAWLKRRHRAPVMPAREGQPRQDAFDQASSRRRHPVERSIGWLKWCRARATRLDKLAMNHVALWRAAHLHYLLRQCPAALGVPLSETAWPEKSMRLTQPRYSLVLLFPA